LDFYRADIRERHTCVLGLPAGVAAHHVRVAEEGGTAVSVERLDQCGVRVGIVAAGPFLARTMMATATGDREWNDNTVANLEFFDLGTDFDNLAHELMAEDVS